MRKVVFGIRKGLDNAVLPWAEVCNGEVDDEWVGCGAGVEGEHRGEGLVWGGRVGWRVDSKRVILSRLFHTLICLKSIRDVFQKNKMGICGNFEKTGLPF